MDLVPIGLTLLAVAVTVVAIAFPLLRIDRADDESVAGDQLSDLSRMREARNEALTAIMDLDDELERNNISAHEHRNARIPLVRRAAALIRDIEGREHILDEEIERVVALRRERMKTSDHSGLSEQPGAKADSSS